MPNAKRIITPNNYQGPSPDELRRMLMDALTAQDPSHRPDPSPRATLQRANDAVQSHVVSQIKSRIPAVWLGTEEQRLKLLQDLFALYGNQYAKWSNYDLVMFIAQWQAEILMRKVVGDI